MQKVVLCCPACLTSFRFCEVIEELAGREGGGGRGSIALAFPPPSPFPPLFFFSFAELLLGRRGGRWWRSYLVFLSLALFSLSLFLLFSPLRLSSYLPGFGRLLLHECFPGRFLHVFHGDPLVVDASARFGVLPEDPRDAPSFSVALAPAGSAPTTAASPSSSDAADPSVSTGSSRKGKAKQKMMFTGWEY